MPDDTPALPAATPVSLHVKARRLATACTLALGLLVLMGVSGLANITLNHVRRDFYDQYSRFDPLPPFEAAVVSTVQAARPAIWLVHKYGGYVTILLSGWAALQCISFARAAGREGAQVRLVALLGGVGGFGLALALAAQIVAGTALMWGIAEMDKHRLAPAGAAAARIAAADASDLEGRVKPLENFHIRELNYPVGLAAMMLVAAMSLARSRAAGQKNSNTGTNHKKD